jgi:hypothetical protein
MTAAVFNGLTVSLLLGNALGVGHVPEHGKPIRRLPYGKLLQAGEGGLRAGVRYATSP